MPPFPVARWMAVASLLALLVRLPYYIHLPVPLNDGGMFAQIVDEIRANGFRLPSHTNYNFLDLPLSYPPLGFYVAALLGALLNQPSIEVMKWIPLAFNVGAVAVFVALASRIIRDPRAVICASLLFAVLPQAGNWLLMGGGLTRSPGFFFSLLAMVAAYDTLQRERPIDAVRTGVFVALAGLSHLESGTLVVVVLPLFGLYFTDWRRMIRPAVTTAVVAALMALPWVVWLAANVGFEPLRYASQTGGAQGIRAAVKTTALGLFLTDRFVGLAILVVPAMIALLRRGRWLLPVWIFVTVYLVARSAYTQVAVPAAILAGISWAAVWNWACNRTPSGGRMRWALIPAWGLVVAGLAGWSAFDKHGEQDRVTTLRDDVLCSLTSSDRRAMEWVKTNTPTEGRFLVISERMRPWYMDMVGEWFPYLSQRHSVLTVQGREWRPNHEFSWWQYALQGGARLPQLRQMDRWLGQLGMSYDYVFVSGPLMPSRASLARQIAASPRFALIHQEGNVWVYRVAG